MKRQNDALKRAREQNVADLQSEVVRTKALLEQSTKNLNDALSRQADVRKEFADLVKGIQATPTSGTQTFGDATAAQASARNALTAGNNQKAIEEALRASDPSATEGCWREQLRLRRRGQGGGAHRQQGRRGRGW